MKQLKFILLAAALLFASCQKIFIYHPVIINNGYERPQNEAGEYGITFDNYNAATKASVTSISNTGYDDFKLYTWNSLNDTIMKPYIVEAVGNDAYSYDGVVGQELQYFKNAASDYEFIGVLPTNKVTTIKDGEVTVEGIQSAVVNDSRVSGYLLEDSPEEFLYTYKKVSKANYNSPVNLEFNHGNAIIYLGFKSNRDDTELLNYVPATQGSISQTFNVKFSNTLWNRAGGTISGLTDEMVAEINSVYELDGYSTDAWPSSGGPFTMTIDENSIPNGYTKTWIIDDGNDNTNFKYFDVQQYLKDKLGSAIYDGISNWPDSFNGSQILVHVKKNTNGTFTGVFFSASAPNVTVVPGQSGLNGIRMFTAKKNGNNYIHEGHVSNADVTVSANGLEWTNISNTTNVIEYSLPSVTTLSSSVKYSPSTFYAIPANSNIKYLVVKLSYEYDGTKVYDVRVPIELPNAGLEAGKYYKYIINITSISNGTTDPDEAITNKDVISSIDNPIINITAIFNDYISGETRTITI